MLSSKYQIFLQQLNKQYVCGFMAEVDFFLILEVPIESPLEIKGILHQIREDCMNAPLTNLAEFEGFLNQEVIKLNLPAHFSCAAAYFKNEVIYLKTYGNAEIFIKRKKNIARLVSQEKSASGFLQNSDLFILTTKNFTQPLNEKNELDNLCSVKNLFDIQEKINQQIKLKNLDLVALFVQFSQPQTSNLIQKIDFSQLKMQFSAKLATSNKKKLTTLVLVGIVLLIFVWSVVFGHQRRQEANQKLEIQTTKELVTKKLNEAAEVSFLNNQKAMTLISEAKDELTKLKSKVTDNQITVKEIENLIQQKENQILKKEEKTAEEFFDLKIENNNASGSKLALSGEDLAILDNKNGAVYNLSLTKKSLTTKIMPEAKSAELITNNKGMVFIFNGKDVYKYDNGKSVKVIENDKNWGLVGQMLNYNGNLYLLDKRKNQIYKYLVTDSGYGSGSAYFKSGQEIDLASVNSLAINGSLYLSFSNEIVKYTSGLRDGFKTNYPKENIQINKVIADKDLEKIYVWDKTNAAVYVLNKDGAYEKEVAASILKTASDVVVFEDNIYVLSGEKIFKISL